MPTKISFAKRTQSLQGSNEKSATGEPQTEFYLETQDEEADGAWKQQSPRQGKYERRDINFISKKVLASYQPLLHSGRPNAVMIRYVAIASDPKGALEDLARDTGLDLALDRLDRPVWLDAEARHEPSWITELEGAEASPASIGSFKRVLNGEEIAMVQQICEPIMSSRESADG